MADPFGPKTYRVVAATDHSEHGNRALRVAIEGVAERKDAELHVVHVIDDMAGGWPGLLDDARVSAVAKARHELQGLVMALVTEHAPSNLDAGKVFLHVRVGSPALQIARLAADLEADLVVVGSHGRRGLSRLFVGSVAERVVRTAPCSVQVVRPRTVPDVEIAPEPPCPACTARRFETRGEKWWCVAHDRHHGRAHVYAHTSTLTPRSSIKLD